MQIIEKRLIYTMKRLLFLAAGVLLSSCSVFCPCSKTDHDPQFIQIYYRFHALEELDTFNGTFQKDLVPGSATATMWFTTRDQEIILFKLEQIHFFAFPDTIYSLPNQIVTPNLGPSILRIKYKNLDKTLVWYYPNDYNQLDDLRELFYNIIFSKKEYKALPPQKSYYQ